MTVFKILICQTKIRHFTNKVFIKKNVSCCQIPMNNLQKDKWKVIHFEMAFKVKLWSKGYLSYLLIFNNLELINTYVTMLTIAMLTSRPSWWRPGEISGYFWRLQNRLSSAIGSKHVHKVQKDHPVIRICIQAHKPDSGKYKVPPYGTICWRA